MKILVLKGPFPRHHFFARQIAEIPGAEIRVMTFDRLGSQRLQKMWKRSFSTFFNRVTKYVFYTLMQWNKREAEYFGDTPPREVRVENLNSRESVDQIKSFQPDVIAVFGTPIISSKIIDIPRYGAINLHGGISPDYKGGNTIFWPLYRDEPEKVGATIHYMLKKVDSGAMLARVYPDLNPKDDEFTASAKTFKYATEEFVELLKQIQEVGTKLPGVQQEGDGHLYLAKHRTAWKDIKGQFKIRRNLKGVELEKRVERFYES